MHGTLKAAHTLEDRDDRTDPDHLPRANSYVFMTA